MFIIELATTTGKVCEKYATYEEAKQRVESFPAGSLVGLPLIFRELADGSERLVREDGKPLQWHRLEEGESPTAADQPLPVSEESLGFKVREILPGGDDPLPPPD